MAAIAILDDYQNVAFKYADWSRIQRDHKVTVFNKHLGRGEPVAKALQDFDVICLMRERTAMPREVIEKLPNLKLLITAGMRNASVDMKAAEDHKVTVCGTNAGHQSTAELARSPPKRRSDGRSSNSISRAIWKWCPGFAPW